MFALFVWSLYLAVVQFLFLLVRVGDRRVRSQQKKLKFVMGKVGENVLATNQSTNHCMVLVSIAGGVSG